MLCYLVTKCQKLGVGTREATYLERKKALVTQIKLSPSFRSVNMTGAAIETTVFSRAASKFVMPNPTMMAYSLKVGLKAGVATVSSLGCVGFSADVSCASASPEEVSPSLAIGLEGIGFVAHGLATKNGRVAYTNHLNTRQVIT